MTEVVPIDEKGVTPVVSGANDLNASQVEMLTSKTKKRMVIGSIVLWCFIDTLGSVLFAPAGPILCQQASGGPIDGYASLLLSPAGSLDFSVPPFQQLPDLFKALFNDLDKVAADAGYTRSNLTYDQARDLAIVKLGHPKAFLDVPVGFSTSSNLLMIAAMASGAVGNAFWGWLSDKVSKKLCMLICCVGGLAGYIIMYIAGIVFRSFWVFIIGMTLNGAFSGAMTISMGYFTNFLGREEAQAPNSALMSMAGLGGAIGSLILMPFISGRAENVFNAALVGMAGTVISFILIVCIISDPPKKTEKQYELSSRSSVTAPEIKEELKEPKLLTRILWIATIASSIDSAGDEGTRIARGTVMMNVWPHTNELMYNNVLLLSMIVVMILVMSLLPVFKKLIGLAWTCVLGCTATLITQLLLNFAIIDWKDVAGYIAVWYGGKLFGFMSTFGAFFIINAMAPEDQIGTWSGRMQGLSGVASCVSTLAISLAYDEFNKDNTVEGRQGRYAMIITAGVSFLAVLSYLPLPALLPKSIDKEEQEKKFRTQEEYEALTTREWKQLSIEEIEFQEERRVKDGKIPRTAEWGPYCDDLPLLAGMLERASDDMEYLRVSTTLFLTDKVQMAEARKFMVEQQKLDEESSEAQEARQKAKDEMGAWLGDYLDDAGYDGWHKYPSFFKVMLMNSFPALVELNGKRCDPATMDIEATSLGFLKALDSHIARRRDQTGFAARLKVGRFQPHKGL